jgi:hypothetical protein
MHKEWNKTADLAAGLHDRYAADSVQPRPLAVVAVLGASGAGEAAMAAGAAMVAAAALAVGAAVAPALPYNVGNAAARSDRQAAPLPFLVSSPVASPGAHQKTAAAASPAAPGSSPSPAQCNHGAAVDLRWPLGPFAIPSKKVQMTSF